MQIAILVLSGCVALFAGIQVYFSFRLTRATRIMSEVAKITLELEDIRTGINIAVSSSTREPYDDYERKMAELRQKYPHIFRS